MGGFGLVFILCCICRMYWIYIKKIFGKKMLWPISTALVKELKMRNKNK